LKSRSVGQWRLKLKGKSSGREPFADPRVYTAKGIMDQEKKLDQQRIHDAAAETAEKVGAIASDAAHQASAGVQGKLDQGKAMIEDMQARATTLAGRASEAGRQAMAQAGEVIQGAAREAGSQATQAASSLYQQGSRAGDFVSRYAAEQPVTALLVAGAIGYGLAYLIHRR